ncbi:hypothetical protein HBH98_011400 [Parastagonospora nodorum]|nr:hypothetical protein HBH51_076410 [Parastagonospora nodorum]KAH3982263.1 hypothetical protein HBH52_077990 [Parastagonospora nodorum]KAH4007439.1 hypothetical protein HBI10_004280 [Parastagonospora nodorum]KAH4023294.1 hypothetical protein HBI13_085990 [Parastagonospora nodorum]KAH4069115.1 hypothetical protein HBH50_109000 [Parastagonospora nodorum]
MGFVLAWSEKGSFETSRSPSQGVRCTQPCYTTLRADHNITLAPNLWLSACVGYIWAVTGVGMESQDVTSCDIPFGPS